MVSFGEKAKIKKAGNLNQGRTYVTTTVHGNFFPGLNITVYVALKIPFNYYVAMELGSRLREFSM